MQNKMEWNSLGAQSRQKLMDALFFATSGLKNQFLTFSALAATELNNLKTRISEIADELYGLQQDAGRL